MTEVQVALDPTRCPLCGEPNACALADGRASEPCWCAGARISPALLARLPVGARGVACVCRRCATEPAAQPAS
jgi:hypothetical protein